MASEPLNNQAMYDSLRVAGLIDKEQSRTHSVPTMMDSNGHLRAELTVNGTKLEVDTASYKNVSSHYRQQCRTTFSRNGQELGCVVHDASPRGLTPFTGVDPDPQCFLGPDRRPAFASELYRALKEELGVSVDPAAAGAPQLSAINSAPAAVGEQEPSHDRSPSSDLNL